MKRTFWSLRTRGRRQSGGCSRGRCGTVASTRVAARLDVRGRREFKKRLAAFVDDLTATIDLANTDRIHLFPACDCRVERSLDRPGCVAVRGAVLHRMNMRMHTVPTDRAERLSGTRGLGVEGFGHYL